MQSFLAGWAANDMSYGRLWRCGCGCRDTDLFREDRCESLELADVALVECEQQLLDPVVRRVVQRVKNRV